MYILLAYFKMFVLCYFLNIDLYMFDKINLLTYLLTYLLTLTYLLKVESHHNVWADVCQRFEKSKKSSKRR